MASASRLIHENYFRIQEDDAQYQGRVELAINDLVRNPPRTSPSDSEARTLSVTLTCPPLALVACAEAVSDLLDAVGRDGEPLPGRRLAVVYEADGQLADRRILSEVLTHTYWLLLKESSSSSS